MTSPWKKPRPKAAPKTKLTPASVRRAKAAAKAAGRRYPNLVDNMNAARAQREAAARPGGKSKTKSKSRARP